MRLNLGCGKDIRSGYVNVDYHDLGPDVVKHDLSRFPWPWENDSASEILMLDFLEHSRYSWTKEVLHETWRVLKPDGFVDIQVPDFAECARAMLWNTVPTDYHCNKCGYLFPNPDLRANFFMCQKCSQSRDDIAKAAMQRLYGGQDHPGNYHFTAFTKRSLEILLSATGFHNFEYFEKNENGETFLQNWNFKVRAHKKVDLWT